MSRDEIQKPVAGLPRLFRRFNDLAVFDASRWPARETIVKIFGSLLIGVFVFKRILQLPGFPGVIEEVRGFSLWLTAPDFIPKSWVARPYDLEKYYTAFGYAKTQIRILWTMQLFVWLTETGVLVGYVVAFLTRTAARSAAKGFMETVFPLTLGLFPFAIIMTDYTYRRWIPASSPMHMPGLYALNVSLILAGTLNVIGLMNLRKAFTIMSEARVFIRTGPYRWVRHPLYASHFVIYFCCMLLHFQALTVVLYVAFVAGQTLRARIEEKKLAAAFPEYEEYRRTTGMFFFKFKKTKNVRGITS